VLEKGAVREIVERETFEVRRALCDSAPARRSVFRTIAGQHRFGAFLAAATGRVAPPASSSSGASPATSIRQGSVKQ